MQISASIPSLGDEPVVLETFENVYPDRTCGQWEAGWLATDPAGTGYFISEAGIVYADDPEKPHDNLSKAVGEAPEIKAKSERYEAQIDAALNHG